MTIAVDFDGTIVEHRYPRIGEEIPFAVETLKLLQQEKHRFNLVECTRGGTFGRSHRMVQSQRTGVLCSQ